MRSVGLGNVRPASGTYGEFGYEGLPPLNPDDHAAMDWLPDGPEQLWAITDVHDQQPSRPFDASGLRGPVGQQAVIVSREPIGFEPIEDLPTPPPPLQIENHDLAIRADSSRSSSTDSGLRTRSGGESRPISSLRPFDSYLQHYRVRRAQPPGHDPDW